MKKLLLYIGRWQLSTPILAIVIWLLVEAGVTNSWISASIANLIGALIFFWVDRLIFKNSWFEIWEVKKGFCDKCNQEHDLRRLTRTPEYDRTGIEIKPIFLCPSCSKQKTEELKARGLHVKGLENENNKGR